MRYSNPIDQICSMQESLSKSEQVIAAYLLEHPTEVIGMTVRELADATSTSSATVSRFARTLGYRNFSAMRTAMAVGASSDPTPDKNGKISFESMQDSVSFILDHKIAELRDTAAMLDLDHLRGVVETMRAADVVLIAAVGNTITTGMNAAFKFEQAGVRANCPTSTEAMASAAVNLTERDMLLVLTTSGYSKKLSSVFDYAEDSGCPIVMVTDNTQTPLARRCSHVIRATARDAALAERFHFSQNSMNFVIELLFLFLVSCWEESEEKARMLDKHLLADRQY